MGALQSAGRGRMIGMKTFWRVGAAKRIAEKSLVSSRIGLLRLQRNYLAGIRMATRPFLKEASARTLVAGDLQAVFPA